MRQNPTAEQAELKRERWELLEHVNALTEKPLIALSFVWLLLLVLDFTRGLNRPLEIASYVIWALFVLDFGIEIAIAPDKSAYLRRNWLTALALVLPAFRLLRVFRALRLLRAARATRSLSLVRLVTTFNRGMRSARATLGGWGIGYVAALTVIVTFVGAAGMYLFENPAIEGGRGLNSYGESVWWTAMLITTIGSEYWPQSAEGRILCWLLSLYAFAVFGYLTATIASYFIGQSPAVQATASTGDGAASVEVERALHEEVAALRTQVASLVTLLEQPPNRQFGAPPTRLPKSSETSEA